jgi:heme exporter protein A
MTPSLRLEQASAWRGHRLLPEGLDLALGPGDAALVTGPNGAGKSTLLRLCAGLLPLASGRIAIDGRIAWDSDQPALDEELPLGRALGFWAALDGATPSGASAALVAMGIAVLAPVPVRLLSTGQRRRAALARVLASGAAVWLLDEPGNGLDVDGLARLATALAAHRAAGGLAVIATHQPLSVPDAVPVQLGPA